VRAIRKEYIILTMAQLHDARFDHV